MYRYLLRDKNYGEYCYKNHLEGCDKNHGRCRDKNPDEWCDKQIIMVSRMTKDHGESCDKIMMSSATKIVSVVSKIMTVVTKIMASSGAVDSENV